MINPKSNSISPTFTPDEINILLSSLHVFPILGSDAMQISMIQAKLQQLLIELE